MYRDSAGNQLSEKDLAGVTGQVNLEIVGDLRVPDEAIQLHDQGRQAGSNGEHEQALRLFEKASKLAPQWPYPIYDAAFTYLLQGNDERALEFYERVVTMAPRGFFTALTAVDCLRREERGEVRRSTYRQYVLLEWVQDAREKESALETILERSPAFPPGWKTLADLIDDDIGKLRAIENGLAHQPDLETKGFLLVSKALVLDRQGKRDEAVGILGDLALNSKSPIDVEEIAKAMLAHLHGLDQE